MSDESGVEPVNGSAQPTGRRAHRVSPQAGTRGIPRRSALRYAAGGLLLAGGAAGGAAWLLNDGSSPAGSEAVSHNPPPPPPGGPAPVWSEQFQPGHSWVAGGVGTASADVNDRTMFTRGAQSARVTTDGSGRQAFLRRAGMPAIDLTAKMIRLVLRVEDVAHLRQLAFYVGTRAFSNYFSWEFHTHSAEGANYVQSGEWVVIHLQWADITKASGAFSISETGVPSVTTGFTDMSFAAYDDNAGPVTVRLQAVEVLPDTSTKFPRGVVSITFDDSFASVYDLAQPVMQAHGFAGTMYNIAEAVGTSRYLTLKQMRDMQDRSGWEMAGHAYSTSAHDASYSQLTSRQVDADFGRLRSWLDANRLHSTHFAYPHGAFQATSDGVPVDHIAAQHFTTARSIIAETVESLVPAMPHRLKALTGLTDGVGIDGSPLSLMLEPGGKLDRCAKNGDWLILAFHQLVPGPPTAGTQISQAGFAAVMDGIAARGIPVLTVGEAMSHFT
ncbi:polysaccharide deacetylase family protein [Yinghuangia seranimata]|uniref:polysaccharide deacetylase family protein n=1 Tax=Yinghuangia seranimata TaxID=408067 RepID=UPI00248D2E40|nr:polysaccharide deacetylase family protein [Yinghuangia seranimata]MDI2130555.1 polysaccharide deacetylase family protein [Yinghuangia seranimata]